MNLRTVLLTAAAAALLPACEARVDPGADANRDAKAIEGTAEEGTFSMDVPGFEMKVRIPDAMQRASINEDNEIIPPGATFRGIHVQANEGAGGSGVELRFTDGRAPDELARWYETDVAGREFRVNTAERRGDGWVIAGETLQDADSFTVRLAPAAGGGTAGRVAIVDRSG